MVFIDSLNTSGTIYQVINGMSSNTTGSDFMTVMLIILFLFLIGIILRMSVELIIILTTPLVLVLMAYDTQFVPLGALFLVALGILLAKNILFSRY